MSAPLPGSLLLSVGRHGLTALWRQGPVVGQPVGQELLPVPDVRVGVGVGQGHRADDVAVIILEPGLDGDGAHAAHEHIKTEDIARRGALLAGLLATL